MVTDSQSQALKVITNVDYFFRLRHFWGGPPRHTWQSWQTSVTEKVSLIPTGASGLSLLLMSWSVSKFTIMSWPSWPFGQDNSSTTFMTKHRGCRFLPPEEQDVEKGGQVGGDWRSALHEEHFSSMLIKCDQITKRAWFETLSLFNCSMFIKYELWLDLIPKFSIFHFSRIAEWK